MPKASTSAAPPPPTAAETQSTFASQLASVPEFESYGPVVNSSKLVPLTESETEYFVTCVKHIFKEHIVFQFNATNTLPETVLEGVSVLMQPGGEGLTEDFIIPIPSLAAADGSQIVYVSFTRDSPEEYFIGGFGCTLKFVSKEIDPDTGMPEETGYPDEYHLEEIEVSAGGDYILPSYCSFNAEWEGLGGGTEMEEEFGLSGMASIKGGCSTCRLVALWLFIITLVMCDTAACESLVEILNMEAIGGTENPSSNAVHTLLLSGIVGGGGGKVLARCQMAYTASTGVSLRMSVRAENDKAASLVIATIG